LANDDDERRGDGLVVFEHPQIEKIVQKSDEADVE
jgi:hypothetical protein